jgi:hypothetical protein
MGEPSIGAVGYMDMFAHPRQMAAPRYLMSEEGHTIIVNWEIVRGYDVIDYELYEGSTQIYKGPMSTYTKYNIVEGRTYSFTVKANNRCGSGEISKPLKYDLVMAQASRIHLAATENTNCSVTVTWSPPSDGRSPL